MLRPFHVLLGALMAAGSALSKMPAAFRRPENMGRHDYQPHKRARSSRGCAGIAGDKLARKAAEHKLGISCRGW